MATWTFSSDEAVRDYLAGQALVGLVARSEQEQTEIRDSDQQQRTLHKLAEQAYALADAMMQERKKGQDRA